MESIPFDRVSLETWDYRPYLSDEEAVEIRVQFQLQFPSVGRLVFWNGIQREWAQQWADERGMMTLTSMMGSLMESSNPRCKKKDKTSKAWQKYMKGASGLFAEYACSAGTVTLLTQPPVQQYSPRANSTYYGIEKPILQGTLGNHAAEKIEAVHPTVAGAEEYRYEVWPQNRSQVWVEFFGVQCTVLTRFRAKLEIHQTCQNSCSSKGVILGLPSSGDLAQKTKGAGAGPLATKGNAEEMAVEIKKRAKREAEEENKAEKAKKKAHKKARKKAEKAKKEADQRAKEAAQQAKEAARKAKEAARKAEEAAKKAKEAAKKAKEAAKKAEETAKSAKEAARKAK